MSCIQSIDNLSATTTPKKNYYYYYYNYRGHYVGIHASGFKDFLLKPELLRAIVDAGFEHPSEVQHETIPQAVLGGDIICQAKSGMGKTAVFTLATLQQANVEESKVSVLVICHTRELAFQIAHEYERFSKYLPSVKTAVFYGGVPLKQNREILKNDCPHIVVGTPGRILGLARDKNLNLDGIKHFVLDECDRVLDVLEFNQVVIFVSKVARAKELNRLLTECNFPSICIHGGMKQEERISQYKSFKDFNARILVATDLFGRGIDIERVNVVVNYDFPDQSDQFLHRVGRAGRFGTKGIAVSFISSETDQEVLSEVQSRFEVNIPELPDEIDVSTYMST